MGARTFQKYGYKAGDTVVFNKSYLGQYAGIWNTAKNVRFLIPLNKPVLTNNITMSGNIYIRTDGLSRVDAVFGDTTITWEIAPTVNGIGISITFATDKGIDQTPCVVQISNGTATFS